MLQVWLLVQCDQIGHIIALWPTFQSLWQQLFCPNYPHFKAIFVKMSKIFMLPVESFFGNFYRHLATFNWSHCSPVVDPIKDCGYDRYVPL